MLLLLFILEFSGLSESEIRRRLTLEEENSMVDSPVIDSDDDFTATKYLLYGLDLEERRYAFLSYIWGCGTNLMVDASYGLRWHRQLLTYHLRPLSNSGPPTVVLS